MKRYRRSGHRVPSHPVTLMWHVYRSILPEVRAQLDTWREKASGIPDPELRGQALASIETKRFHCQGGAVYAVLHSERKHILIPLIVALQTISDYLDNLCDRSTSLDPEDFRLLHQAMLDAVDPDAPLRDYYALREEREDSDYLHHLVRTCQTCICLLPSYDVVKADVKRLVGLYCDLQVHKHIRKDLRESALLGWWNEHRSAFPELRWNEFAAATGSTLGMFMLFAVASFNQAAPERADAVTKAYFPYICGLHILLDYFIDQEEDRVGGDLNFCSYYESTEQLRERLVWIVESARRQADLLPEPAFHRMIVEGLLGLYLSDPKIRRQPSVYELTRTLLRNSPLSRLFFWINSKWIRKTSR